MPGKKLLLRSILFCRKFWSDAVFDVLWMSTTCFIGILTPSARVAHQPSRRLYWSVCELPAPAAYVNGPVPTIFERSEVLPVVISLALYRDQMWRGTIGIEYRLKSHSWKFGVPRKWKVTVFARVEIRVRPVFHIVEYCEPASLPVSKVNLTSAAVSGLPSLQLTPRRIVTT
jgi:hypothetical protein